ncbi:MAG TPA: hypothetical protein VHX42_01095 [Candidatus Babeliales bacterium]|jgi:hypothetical protein|nr:hypothetical protein [Candidatus Babeliales bacterium]
MKKQLLTILLTITPFLISATPSNAELLAHLKSVRIEILNDIIVTDETAESIFGLNILNEFYNTSQLLQQDISSIVNNNFELLCNMAPYSRLFYIPMDQKPPFTDTEEQDLYRLFKSIYVKLHQDYCKNNPNGTLVNATAHNVFQNEAMLYKTVIHEMIIRTHGLIWPKALIKKIDTKIAELSLPFEALAK